MRIEEACEALGISKGDSLEDAKKAYRVHAIKCHPDKNPDDPDATAKFQKIGAAYALITKFHESGQEWPERGIANLCDRCGAGGWGRAACVISCVR